MTFQLFRRSRERDIQQAQIRAVAASPLFDPDWYLRQYPDVAAAGEDPAHHYVTKGATERRSPGPNFDADAYLTSYPDVAASGVNPLLHYMQFGMAEGRDAKLEARIRAVAASPLFDAAWYLQQYPDVAASGEDPARHYTLCGASERRLPGPNFDAEAYLTSYPDVAASGVNPLLHYITWGVAEGRDFQLDAQIRAVAASPLFDREWYLRRYPDVAEAGLDPARHYATQGAAERRSPGPDFDAGAYLAAYPDVAASGVNPLLHYMHWGKAEGRDPKPQSEEAERYRRWVQEFDTLDDADRIAIRAHIAAFARRPVISIVVPVYETKETYLREMFESVLQQIYPDWELCVADDAFDAAACGRSVGALPPAGSSDQDHLPPGEWAHRGREQLGARPRHRRIRSASGS